MLLKLNVRIQTDSLNEDKDSVYISTFNGYYFSHDGDFLKQITTVKYGNKDDVYAQKNDEDSIFKKLPIQYNEFIEHAATIYVESSASYGVLSKEEMFAIASAHIRNNKAYAKGKNDCKRFIELNDTERNALQDRKYAVAAEINTLLGGHDYSNGANFWDGAEQANLPIPDATNNNEKKWEYKINTQGWDIKTEHYDSWKSALINNNFSFNVPQKKYAITNYNKLTGKDKITLQSTAQYGLTIFWKSVNIDRPK